MVCCEVERTGKQHFNTVLWQTEAASDILRNIHKLEKYKGAQEAFFCAVFWLALNRNHIYFARKNIYVYIMFNVSKH